jgi:hypothetical protein
MRFFFSTVLFFALLSLSAQDTLLITQVDNPPSLNPDDVRGAKKGANQDVLFLTSIYNTVKYPRYARENGVRAVVGVTFLVGTDGKVSVEKTRAFTMEQADNIYVPKDELIIITAYSRRSVNGGPGYSVSSPRQTKNEKRLLKAYASLEEAAAASVLALPDFIPGTFEDNPVVVRATRFFVFNME